MRLTGKLVGDIAESNWHDLMAEYGAREYVSNGYSQSPQEGYDWDAIANALNDMLGPGTCHNASGNSLYFVCSGCGDNPLVIRPHYCPNCGRRVVEVADG